MGRKSKIEKLNETLQDFIDKYDDPERENTLMYVGYDDIIRLYAYYFFLKKRFIKEGKLNLRNATVHTLEDPDAYLLQLSLSQCDNSFRFTQPEIDCLFHLLDFEIYHEKHIHSPMSLKEALLLLLLRYSSFKSYQDLSHQIGRPRSTLNIHANDMAYALVKRYGTLVELYQGEFLTEQKVKYYAEIINQRKAKIPNVFGFIDGTSVIIGSDNDAHISQISQLDNVLKKFVYNGEKFYVYGDKGYTNHGQIVAEYKKNHIINLNIKEINDSMCRLRVSVENVFADLKQSFSGAINTKTYHVGKNNLVIPFRMAALLHNFRICIRGTSTAASNFHCRPPSLQEYLSYAKRDWEFQIAGVPVTKLQEDADAWAERFQKPKRSC